MWLSYSSLIPPNLFILMAGLGLVLAVRWKRLGLVVAAIGTGCLYLASTPLAAYFLVHSAEALVEAVPALPCEAQPEAIVVLSGDYRRGASPGQPATVGPLTLERLAAAASVHRRLGLPVLVSGGRVAPDLDTLAEMMSRTLEDGFGVAVRWREDRSLNTFENASFSAAMLRQSGIRCALVVTHPWHMARALWAFHAVGYSAIPAFPRDERTLALTAGDFLPQVPALLNSYYALHELIGLAWYRLVYGNDW